MAAAIGANSPKKDKEVAVGMPTVFAAPSLPNCDARDGTSDTRPLSELGNASRLFDKHGNNLRYVQNVDAWLIWQDGSWRWDIKGTEIRCLAAELPDAIYAEGSRHIADSQHYAKWSRISQKRQTISNAVSLLSDFPGMRLPLSDIDSDTFIVGFDLARQVIDLKTGVTRLALRSDYITRSLKISRIGDPNKAVRWLSFLKQVFDADAELIDWLQRWCGYALTGSTVEQFFIFAYGLGANGKSVFAETLKYIIGDYARAISPETLTESKRQAGSATPDLAALIGTRLALSSETEEGSALAESLVKSLVSGDSMSVRQLYSGPIEFTSTFKLLILGNHMPVIRGNDNGIWRRVRLLPFRKTFSPEDRDPLLLAKLKEEAPHILAWMVQGCIKWQRLGLADLPSAILAATDSYKRDQDVIGDWLEECCITSPSSKCAISDLYENYQAWCGTQGLNAINNRSFGRRLGERGFTSRRSNGHTWWFGLSLTGTSALTTMTTRNEGADMSNVIDFVTP